MVTWKNKEDKYKENLLSCYRLKITMLVINKGRMNECDLCFSDFKMINVVNFRDLFENI